MRTETEAHWGKRTSIRILVDHLYCYFGPYSIKVSSAALYSIYCEVQAQFGLHNLHKNSINVKSIKSTINSYKLVGSAPLRQFGMIWVSRPTSLADLDPLIKESCLGKHCTVSSEKQFSGCDFAIKGENPHSFAGRIGSRGPVECRWCSSNRACSRWCSSNRACSRGCRASRAAMNIAVSPQYSAVGPVTKLLSGSVTTKAN